MTEDSPVDKGDRGSNSTVLTSWADPYRHSRAGEVFRRWKWDCSSTASHTPVHVPVNGDSLSPVPGGLCFFSPSNTTMTGPTAESSKLA